MVVCGTSRDCCGAGVLIILKIVEGINALIYNVCENVRYQALSLGLLCTKFGLDQWRTGLSTISGLGVHTAKLLWHGMQTLTARWPTVTELYANCYGTVSKLLWHCTTTIASYSPRNGNDKITSLLRWHYYVFICMKTPYCMFNDNMHILCLIKNIQYACLH